jgi:hypothetical protein
MRIKIGILIFSIAFSPNVEIAAMEQAQPVPLASVMIPRGL